MLIIVSWVEIEVKLKHKEKELDDILSEKKTAESSSEGTAVSDVHFRA